METPAYRIKNLKTFRGVEGNGFNATLYLGQKRLGTVIDDASGGPVIFEISDADKKALDDYAQSLPDIVCPFNDHTGKPAVLKNSADLFVSHLVNQVASLKRVKSILRKGTMLAVIEDHQLYKIEYMRDVNTKIINDYQKNYPNAVVLNRLSDADILAALAAHGV